MMNTARAYQRDNLTGIHNEDDGVQVGRVLIDGDLSSRADELLRAFAVNQTPVWQDAANHGVWFAGYRSYLEHNLALQLISLHNNMFWDYWYETIEPHIHTVLGTIYVVNSVEFLATYTYIQQRIALHNVYNTPLPWIMACSRSDSPDAWSPDDIRIVMNIPPEIPVVPCVTTDAESVKNVLLVLLVLLMYVRDRLENAPSETDI